MDSVSLGWFVLSQTIYSIGSIAIMSALFELRLRQHIGKIVLISFLMSVINYLIYFNQDEGLGYIVPIVGILVFFLYLAAVVKVPTIWAFLITVSGGIITPLIIQLCIVFGTFGFFGPENLRDHIWRNYILDVTSGITYTVVAFLLYFQGWSFRFDFEKIRFVWEKYLIISVSTLATICLPASIIWTHFSNMTLSLVFLTLSAFLVFVILLGYSLKKEYDEATFLKNFKEVK